jgi:hypothetical protein
MTTTLQPTRTNSDLDEIIAISKDQHVMTDGPLSAIYTKTLNALYAKEVDPATGICVESQVNDASVAATLWLAEQAVDQTYANQGESVGLLYGVSKGSVGVSDVIKVSETLSEMTPAQKDNSAIIIDSAIGLGVDGELTELSPAQYQSIFDPALEAVAAYHGVAVFESLQAFVHACKGKV